MADYNLGTAQGVVELDFKDNATAKATGALNNLEGVGKKIGGAMAAAAKMVAVAAVATGVAAVKLGIDAAKAASDLQQTTGAVEAVFKGQASVVKQWAEDAARGIGLSQTAYQQFASVIGSQFKNMGVPLQEVAGKTNDLISMGADLAAQFGGPTSDAVSALSALFRGETDPIERYGVSIKEADIKAQMLADGTSKLTGAQAKLARQQAITNLLMKQTADAQGAAAREANTWEGAIGRLRAVWTNLKAVLGGPILTIATALVQRFTTLVDTVSQSQPFQDLIARVNTMASAFAASDAPLGGIIGQVVAIVRGFTPLGILLRAITPILPQLGAAFGAVGKSLGSGLGAVLPKITPLLDTIARVVGTLVASALPPLVQIFTAVMGAVVRLLPPLAQLAGQVLGAIARILPSITPLFQILADVLGSVLAAVLPVVVSLLGAVSQMFAALIPVLTPIIAAVMQVVQALAPMIVAIGELIGALLPPLIALFTQMITAVLGAAQPLLKALLPALVDIIKWMAGLVTAIAKAITWFVNFANGSETAKADALKAWNAVLDFFRKIPGWVAGVFASAITWLVSAGRNVLAGLQNGATAVWNTVNAWLGGLPGKIKDVFSGAIGWLVSAGSNLLKGLWNGINDSVGWILRKVGGIVDQIIGKVTSMFGIHSPSTVFAGIGENLLAGLERGLDDTRRLEAQMVTLAQSLTDAFDPKLLADFDALLPKSFKSTLAVTKPDAGRVASLAAAALQPSLVANAINTARSEYYATTTRGEGNTFNTFTGDISVPLDSLEELDAFTTFITEFRRMQRQEGGD